MFDIEEIRNPEFLKKLNIDKLEELANSIRNYMIISNSKTGGYLLPNLSSIEIEIALHYVFNTPKDKIVFDNSFMGYTHKILTGRAKAFKKLRHKDGISSNINTNESIYDAASLNHPGNGIGVACGIALNRDLNNSSEEVIVMIDHNTLIHGSSLEALSRIGLNGKKLIIILNDNSNDTGVKWGHRFLNNMRFSKEYHNIKNNMKNMMSKNEISRNIYSSMESIKDNLKEQFINGGIFDLYNINYFGIIDGHNLKDVIKSLNNAKDEKGPVLLHFKTALGHGYDKYENGEKKYSYLTESFNIETGMELVSTPDGYYTYDDLIAHQLDFLMRDNDKIYFISTKNKFDHSFKGLYAKYPLRTFNIDCMHDYAIELAYGLSLCGIYPVIQMDSSLYKKAFDQFHDLIFSNDVNCTIILSNSGLINGEDFKNQGIFDINLNDRNNLVITEAKNGAEIKDLLYTSTHYNKPFIIRYPKAYVKYQTNDFNLIKIAKWDIIYTKDEYRASIIAYGKDLINLKKEMEINELDYQLINARFINPIDEELLDSLFNEEKPILVYQVDYQRGGLADNILRYQNKVGAKNKIIIKAINDSLSLGTVSQMRDELAMNLKDIIKELEEVC